MRRIPRHVAARIRSASEADAIHAYENRGAEPTPKTGGPCQLCNKPEDDHYAGLCNDLRSYTPAAKVIDIMEALKAALKAAGPR